MNLSTVTPVSSQPATHSAIDSTKPPTTGFRDILAKRHAAGNEKPSAQTPIVSRGGPASVSADVTQREGGPDGQGGTDNDGQQTDLSPALPAHTRRSRSPHSDNSHEEAASISAAVYSVLEAASALTTDPRQHVLSAETQGAAAAFQKMKEAMMTLSTPTTAADESTPALLPTTITLPQTDATGPAGHSALGRAVIASSAPLITEQAPKLRLAPPVLRHDAAFDSHTAVGALRAVATMQTRLESASPDPAVAMLSDFMDALAGMAARSAQTASGQKADRLFNLAGSAAIDNGMVQADGATFSGGAATAIMPAAPGSTPMSLFPGLPTTSAAVTASLSSSAWAPEFGRQLTALAQRSHDKLHSIELRLDPPELGPLRIALQVHDNVTHALIVSAHASVRQAVENALPQLQEQLAEAGLTLGQASVSDFGQTGTELSEQGWQSSKAGTPAPDTGKVKQGAVASSNGQSRPPQSPDALVDIYA